MMERCEWLPASPPGLEPEVAVEHLLRYSVEREEKTMARKELTDKISIYIPHVENAR